MLIFTCSDSRTTRMDALGKACDMAGSFGMGGNTGVDAAATRRPLVAMAFSP